MENNTKSAVISRRTDFEDRRVCSAVCSDYDQTRVDGIIDDFFTSLGAEKIIAPGSRVVIKPNLVIRRSPEEATTTHPAVVTAVIRALKKRGINDITIAESSGGLYNKTAMNAVFSGCGITGVCEKEGVALNQNFDYAQVDCPGAMQCHQFNIIEPIIEADAVINIAKLKTHAMTGFSGCVKNMFGSVPGLGKPEMHCQYPDMSDFQQMIVDLCTLTAPTISIMDAVMCMEGDGPTGGSPRFVGALLGGVNPFAVDIAACRLIAVEPENIHMLRHGINRGLSPASLGEVELIGDDLEPIRVADFRQPKSVSRTIVDYFPAFLQPIVDKGKGLISSRPVINKKKCIGCGKCAESCPQHTITIDRQKRRAVIDYKPCIKCFCCHEMCPVRAIDIKRAFIVKM